MSGYKSRFSNQYPGIREQNVVPFKGVIDEIVDTRHGVLAQHAVPSALFLEVDLPVAPLHAENVVPHVDDEALAPRARALASQKIVHVQSIDWTVSRDSSSGVELSK